MEKRDRETAGTARVEPLLRWLAVTAEEISREDYDPEEPSAFPAAEALRRLKDFITSFNGPPLRVGKIQRPWTRETSPQERDYGLRDLALRLNMILLGGRDEDAPLTLQLRRESSVRVVAGEPRIVHTLVVGGSLPDVVLYLAMRLVVDEQLELGTCEAPAAGPQGRQERNWRRWDACGNLFVVRRQDRQYCSRACKRRAENPNWKKVQGRAS